MPNKFKPGDKVRVLSTSNIMPVVRGREGTIISGLIETSFPNGDPYLGYRCEIAGAAPSGQRVWVGSPDCFEPILNDDLDMSGDRDMPIPWNDKRCVWRPEEQKVKVPLFSDKTKVTLSESAKAVYQKRGLL